MSIVSEGLLAQLLAFRGDRHWEQFHTPKNLAAALSVEAAELLECFQWTRDADLEDLVRRERASIEDEVADIAILLSYLCHDLSIDLDSAVRSKLDKNRQKYPLQLARDKATKYDRL
jgi:NTP pyrophosphatase (non-canonical NTP hydrolase)